MQPAGRQAGEYGSRSGGKAAKERRGRDKPSNVKARQGGKYRIQADQGDCLLSDRARRAKPVGDQQMVRCRPGPGATGGELTDNRDIGPVLGRRKDCARECARPVQHGDMSDADPVGYKSHTRRRRKDCEVLNVTPALGYDAGVPAEDPTKGFDTVPVGYKSSSRKQQKSLAWSDKPVRYGIRVDANPVWKKARTRPAGEPLKAPWKITNCPVLLPKIQVPRQKSRG